MKNLLFTYIILISSVQIVTGQEKNQIEKISSGIWYLEYIEIDGNKKQLEDSLKDNNWMVFYENGEHEVMSLGKKNLGNWEYIKDTQTIKITDNGEVSNQKIIRLNENVLVLSFEQEGIPIKMGLTK